MKQISMEDNEFNRWVASSLNTHLKLLVSTKARLDALQHVVDALVATHPKPESMRKILDLARADLVDELHGDDRLSAQSEELNGARLESWKQTLAHYADLLSAVERARKDGDDSSASDD